MAKPVDPWWRKERPENEWRIYEDFRYFLFLVWLHLKLPDPTPIQYDIALYLQHGPERKIIEAFRGIGKSYITSAYVCWQLLRDPQKKFMVVSASKDRADAFSQFTKRLIAEMPLLQHLYPRPNQRTSNVSFDVAPAMADHSPSVKSVGIFGQLTGSRADEIVADDVEVPNNAETQGMRDKLSERVKEFDAVLKPGGRITYLGTPQTEDSLYNEIPKRGYSARIWPVRIPSKKDATDKYGGALAPYIIERISENTVGLPTDPDRFDDIDLMKREASYGRSGFALQFMLDTSLSDQDKYPLKLADLIVMSIDKEVAPEKLVWSADPEYVLSDLPCVGMRNDRYYGPAAKLGDWIKYTGSVLAIDPAGRGKDETGWCIIKMLNGYLYVLECGGIRGGYEEETLEFLAKKAEEYKVNSCIIEANFGDGMFTRLFQPVLTRIYPVICEEVRHSRQKELRIIDTLEPVMNRHRLVINKRLVEEDRKSTEDLPPEQRQRYQLFYQLTRITKERGALAQDDRLDVLAIGVAYWTEQMSQDEDDKIKQRKDRIMKAELEAFVGRPGISIEGLAMGMTPEEAIKSARRKSKKNRLRYTAK